MHHSLAPAARDLRRWATMAEDPGSPLHALLDAERVLGRLTTALGAAEVHLLPLELLATDPGEYGARLSRALGEPIELPTGDRQNVRRIDRDEWATSTTVGAGGIGRAVYRLYARHALPLPPRILLRRSPGDVPSPPLGNIHQIRLPLVEQRRLTRAFGPANERLLRRFDLDPVALGYR